MNGLQMKYFVLNPNKKDVYGEASRCAMLAYADAIEEENHDLWLDLVEWIARIERKMQADISKEAKK